MYAHLSRRARRLLLSIIGPLMFGVLLTSCNSGPVTPPDQPPTVKKDLVNWWAPPGATRDEDLRLVFDGNNLTYSAESDYPDVVAVSVSGYTLTWTAAQNNVGLATVTVTAKNSGGSNATRFQVDVAPLCVVGATLGKGDRCMVQTTATNRLLYIFYVDSDGKGCIFGGSCNVDGWLNWHGFEVSRSGDTWTIEQLPATDPTS